MFAAGVLLLLLLLLLLLMMMMMMTMMMMMMMTRYLVAESRSCNVLTTDILTLTRTDVQMRGVARRCGAAQERRFL